MVGRMDNPRLNPDNVVCHRVERRASGSRRPRLFVGPWLGFMDKLVVKRPIRVDGLDPITSAAYAFDYQEVKNVGATSSADRTARQQRGVPVLQRSPPLMYGMGLIEHLAEILLTLRQTTPRLFARLTHGALTHSVITCWRLKYGRILAPVPGHQRR